MFTMRFIGETKRATLLQYMFSRLPWELFNSARELQRDRTQRLAMSRMQDMPVVSTARRRYQSNSLRVVRQMLSFVLSPAWYHLEFGHNRLAVRLLLKRTNSFKNMHHVSTTATQRHTLLRILHPKEQPDRLEKEIRPTRPPTPSLIECFELARLAQQPVHKTRALRHERGCLHDQEAADHLTQKATHVEEEQQRAPKPKA